MTMQHMCAYDQSLQEAPTLMLQTLPMVSDGPSLQFRLATALHLCHMQQMALVEFVSRSVSVQLHLVMVCPCVKPNDERSRYDRQAADKTSFQSSHL